MATGAYDANGIWQYGEDDNIALFSDLLNLGQESTSDAFTDDRARIAFLEQSVEQASTFVASSAAARNSYWGIPANATEQLALQNKGARTVRTDLGYTEQYYAAFNVSTNPGGRDVAGWYRDGRTTGMMPMRPSSATFVTGTGTVNDLGVVTYTGCSYIKLNNVFTSEFENYKVIISRHAGNTTGNVHYRMSTAGTEMTANYYYQALDATNTGISGYRTLNAAQGLLGYQHNGQAFNTEVMVHQPFVNAETWTRSQPVMSDGYIWMSTVNCRIATGNSYDGFSLFASGGTFSGRLQIFGITD